MLKECWKVTDECKSWSQWSIGRLALSYAVGKKTTPKIGRIFCFDSSENAKKFLRNKLINCSKTIVFKGLAENPTPVKIMSCGSQSIVDFWRILKNKKRVPSYLVILPYGGIPQGSLYAKSFTPTNKYSYRKFLKLKG